MDKMKYNMVDFFQGLKQISDRVPTDFGGGSPLSKTFLMAYLALEFNLNIYVEIGIYRGKSLFPMAHAAKILNGLAYGIDAYDLEVAKEYDVDIDVVGDVNEFLASLDFAQMYNDVKNLQEELGFRNHSVIIKDDSKNAVRYFKENNISIDMLHIDGNHDTNAVQADVDAYVPLVRDGGFIVVDDINWDSVKRVYQPMEKEYQVVFNDGNFAILLKEKPGASVPSVLESHLYAIYSLSALVSQAEGQKSHLTDEDGTSLVKLIEHIEAQSKAILSLTSQLADREQILQKLFDLMNEKEKAIRLLENKARDAEQAYNELREKMQKKQQANVLLEEKAAYLERTLHELTEHSNAAIQELRDQVLAREQHITALDKSIADIFKSTSWKVTRPIRSIRPLAQKVLNVVRGQGDSEENTNQIGPREATRHLKVSVVVTSYNHEKYIAQCLDSILMQKGFFQLEIILGDDCSKDGTAGIMTRYQKKYPKLMKVLTGEANLGVTKNLERCLSACTGDYIAICEGDDYWLDEYKLQKQVEYLETHGEYSMCFSSFLFLYEGENSLVPFEPQVRLKKKVLTTIDLIEENYIGNFSCCMYRSRTVQNLPKEIFDVFTVDWMFNMACGDQGPIGFMPQPMSVYRKHRTGTWTGKAELDQIDTVLSLIDRYDQLLGGTYKAQFEKRKAHLTAFKKRLAKTPELEVLGEDGRKFDSPPSTLNPLNQTYLVDLVVLDTVFPHPLSPFRNQEFINYLDHFPSSLVLTTGEHLPAFKEKRDIVEIINTFEQEHAEYAGRTIPSDHNLERYTARLAYAIFLDNIWSFLDAIEEKKIPFVFTLYPGGGFKLNIPECDAKLIRVFGSSQFRKVIVTQKVTYDYLLEKNFCPPEKIEFLYGVVTPLTILRDFNHKIWYGGEKQRLDICFVAHKYMEGGIDKGYDLFIEAAKKLAAEITNIHFHVVGNFDEADYPIDGLVGRLTFYGQRHQDWFDEFYRDKDIILSPNKPFTLLPGTFDGFPTASCTEAGLRKVAIFCTDILMLNMKFTDRKDIVIIQPDVLDIVETIMYYYENPAELRAVAENGFRRIRTVYNFENQISPRIQIIEQELQNKA